MTPPSSQAPRTQSVGHCPVCHGSRTREHFRAPDRLHGVSGEFQYRRCDDCGSVFQDPQVIGDDLGLCYPSDYFTHGPSEASEDADAARSPSPSPAPPQPLPPPGSKSLLARSRAGLRDLLVVRGNAAGGWRGGIARRVSALRRALTKLDQETRAGVVAWVRGEPRRGIIGVFARLLALRRAKREELFSGLTDELIPRSTRSGRAIDIGCGAGQVVRLLAEAGWQSEGIEWDRKAASVARAHSARPVHEGDFRQADLPRRSFDLVSMQHVFEHLADPGTALRHVAELLAPGGIVCLAYPNPEALGARLFHDRWYCWDPPRHLVLPSIRGLRLAAREAGLEVREVRVSARGAPHFFACSRAYREGRPAHSEPPTRRERLLAFYERLGIRCGLSFGEEIIAVLQLAQASEASNASSSALRRSG